jgi:hypothetical protein
LESAPQGLLIGNSLPAPTFENAVDPNAFDPLKPLVVEIGIVNHFADRLDDFVPNAEALNQSLKSAIVAPMCEIGVEHVERNQRAI